MPTRFIFQFLTKALQQQQQQQQIQRIKERTCSYFSNFKSYDRLLLVASFLRRS